MWKKLEKYLPKQESLKRDNGLRWLGKRLQNPELWQLNCQTVAKGTAFGLLCAFIPLPGQTLGAALLAYLGRANIAIAIAMTWVSNPLTFIPLNYGIYKVGQWLTRDNTPYHPLSKFHWQGATVTEMAAHLGQWLSTLGKPFLIGTIVVACFSAIAGYLLVKIVWQLKRKS